MDKGLDVLNTSYTSYASSSGYNNRTKVSKVKGERSFKSVIRERSDRTNSSVNGQKELLSRSKKASAKNIDVHREEKVDSEKVKTIQEEILKDKVKSEQKLSKTSAVKTEKTSPDEGEVAEVQKSENIFSELDAMKEALNEFISLLEMLFNDFSDKSQGDKLTSDVFHKVDFSLVEGLDIDVNMLSTEMKLELQKMIQSHLDGLQNLIKLVEENSKSLTDKSRDLVADFAEMAKRLGRLSENDGFTFSELRDRVETLVSSMNGEMLDVRKTNQMKFAMDEIQTTKAAADKNTVSDDEEVEKPVLKQDALELTQKSKSKADAKATFTKASESNENSLIKEISAESNRELEADYSGKVKEKTETQNQIKQNMRIHIFEQLSAQIAKKPMKVGESSEMIIRLKPEELGKVELKIEVHKETVIAKMNVESQVVKEAIESSLEDLKSSLKDKGFSEMTFSVDVGSDRDGSEEKTDSRIKAPLTIEREDDLDMMIYRYNKSLESAVNGSSFEHLA